MNTHVSARIFVFLFIVLTGIGHAQDGIDIISQRGSVSIMPLYQQWTFGNDGSFSEAGVDVSIYIPVLRELAFTLRNTPVTTAGEPVEKISGFTDTQIGLLYHLEDQHLLFSLGANLPTGKRELTREEFLSNVLLSNTALGMQVTQFGQGVNLNPGVMWSVMAGENVALGLGLTYHYKGIFKPIKGSGEYDPGDEILATAGADWSLGEASNLSIDVIFTHYGADVFENEDVYAAGNKIVGGIQYSRYFENNRLTLAARYRSYGKGEAPIAGVLAPTFAQSEPDNAEFAATYSMKLSDQFNLGVLVSGRYYQETITRVSGVKLGGVGVMPEYWITRSIRVPARVVVQFGTMKDGRSLTGIEAGLGVHVGL